MSWTTKMYAAGVVGAILAFVWPLLVQRVREQPVAFEDASPAVRILAGVAVGAVVGALVIGVALAAFLGSNRDEDLLRRAGEIGYVLAFGLGFGAGSFVEEPLKRGGY